MPTQAHLFDLPAAAPPGMPEGFGYQPDVVTAQQEAELAERLAALPFVPFDFRGYQANRHVIYFGWSYDFTKGQLRATEPMPDWLLPIRDQAAAFAGLSPDDLPHVLINKYAPGAGIGWHRDRPQFEDVVGVSLLAPCDFRLRRRTADGFERATFTAQPRSAYLLRGSARDEWEHSIPPLEALRYSVTFRSLRPGRRLRTEP